MTLTALETALDYHFTRSDLLEQALTHRSHSSKHNERLEFLGDSVLNCAIALLLFEKFGKIDEGDLSRLRATLVKQASLAEAAQRLELSTYLRLGEGELKSGGFRRPSILADTLEALFGAILLDGGFDAAYRTIAKLYKPVLHTIDPKTLGKDAKTLLQEHLQGRKLPLPIYTVIATHGAAHSQEFEVECGIPKLDIQVVASGGSRRAAEQAAAKRALEAVLAASPPSSRRNTRAKKITEQLMLPVATVQQSALQPAARISAIPKTLNAAAPSPDNAAAPTASAPRGHTAAISNSPGASQTPPPPLATVDATASGTATASAARALAPPPEKTLAGNLRKESSTPRDLITKTGKGAATDT